MNLFGSSKALLGNSISSMLAAIEIYNKPVFNYRNECFSILLLNSWELVFKAILSKNRQRIFRPKEKGKPLKTLLFYEAMEKAKLFFPSSISQQAVIENITKLYDYRNNATHFYNEKDFGIIIFGLAQTSIVNYRDIVYDLFKKDIAEEINLSLLPLSFSKSPDPIEFIKNDKNRSHSPYVEEYLKAISNTTQNLEKNGIDTGRFLTVFKVNFQSTKKIASADLVIGVDKESTNKYLNIERRVDPNESYPLLRKDILIEIGSTLNGQKFNSYTFDCIVKTHKIKNIERFCWNNKRNKTYQYSRDLIVYITTLTAKQIEDAVRKK